MALTDTRRATLRATEGLVFAIDQTATHDGPGLRMLVYLKGCPLRCTWCHSPEAQLGRPQVVWYPDRCQGCGACITSCPQHLRSLDPLAEPNAQACALCGTCIDTCDHEALELKGDHWTAGDVFDAAQRQRPFFRQGGGVTLSGGEPAYQPEFSLAVLTLLHDAGIHTAVETTGLTTWANLAEFAAVTDLFLYDLKLVDDERHRQHTGVSNKPILDNLARLLDLGAEVVVRVPCIPGYTDGEHDLQALAVVVKALGGSRVSLLPYNPVTGAKYAWLQRAHPLPDARPQTAEEMARLGAIVVAQGLELVPV